MVNVWSSYLVHESTLEMMFRSGPRSSLATIISARKDSSSDPIAIPSFCTSRQTETVYLMGIWKLVFLFSYRTDIVLNENWHIKSIVSISGMLANKDSRSNDSIVLSVRSWSFILSTKANKSFPQWFPAYWFQNLSNPMRCGMISWTTHQKPV